MAINAFEISGKNPPPISLSSVKGANRSPIFARTFKNFDDASTRRGKTKKKKNSPYLNNEKVQLLSRMTEKRLIQKKNEIFSSFPLAATIYRASSDEFKALRKSRNKTRKSVLTLPNVPAPIPQSCTVSDMNDTEYFNHTSENKTTSSKRFPHQNRKIRISKGFEFYDRDAKHFLECSSTDLLPKKFEGDGKTTASRGKKSEEENFVASDVWSVLRNINKFQFSPTPRISDADSFTSKKKRNLLRKYRNRKGRRLIETRRTAEISYVANFEIQSKTSASQSSSFDRVTVINKGELQNAAELIKHTAKPQNPQRVHRKRNNTIPLNERNAIKYPPKHNFRQTNVKVNQITPPMRNTQVNRLSNNELSTEKQSESRCTFRGSIDSSNCLRVSDHEETSSINLGTRLTHPSEFKEILNNGCSPRGFRNLNKLSDKEKPLKITNDTEVSSSEKITKGMTQVVYNNNNLNSSLNRGLQKPKPRLVTTMPSAATMPKLTASDIKKRLSQIKFPLVVLGKDQLSSTMEVLDYDPPQFLGLNKHIWPYMLEWKKKNVSQKKMSTPRPVVQYNMTSNLRKANNETSLLNAKDKKLPNDDLSPKKRVECKLRETEIPNQSVLKKTKPVRQLKDKMLQILYKNPSPSIEQCQNTEPIKHEPQKVDASTEITLTAAEEHMSMVPKEPKKVISFVGQKKILSPKKVAFEEEQTTSKKPEVIFGQLEKPRNTLQALHNMKMPGSRYPWAKAKWASDFVDNVIRKMKNGSYYRIDEKKYLEDIKENCSDIKDVPIESIELADVPKVDMKQNISQNECKLNDDSVFDPLISIPGFDDTILNLELKTLNVHQIQVKNCSTNVMVQFDVSVPNKPSSHLLDDKRSSSSSCIPLSVTDSNTKVFKCSTTLLNAVLPAELCTVIPKLMRDIFDSSSSAASSHVTISELSGLESDMTRLSITSSTEQRNTCVGSAKSSWLSCYQPFDIPENNLQVPTQNDPRIYNQNCSCMELQNLCMDPHSSCTAPHNPWTTYWLSHGWRGHLSLYQAPFLKTVLGGRFGYIPHKRSVKYISTNDAIRKIKLNWSEKNILLKSLNFLMHIEVNPMKVMAYNSKHGESTAYHANEVIEAHSACTALRLYKGSRVSWIPSLGEFTILLQKMWNYCKFNIHLNLSNYMYSYVVSCDKKMNCNNFTVNVEIAAGQGEKKYMSVTISNSYINSYNLEDSFSPMKRSGAICDTDLPPMKRIGCSRNSHMFKLKNDSKLTKKVQDKVRKRRFVRLYRKCKSTSNEDEDKTSMPISKIVNMEDFTQALGAAKVLCSVFDGCSGQKVLKCIGEMKSWIKDLSPRQALLVLLLANKKETPNLVRFRPVLLQGIAVNRITRASELDMEIEVIEKENVQLSQCEGISYIPASDANQDGLFEELCWIAKTTASDYQKPFDASSEKLLKSLLGKRKKLNPSYLRVMARYVGLGLLKTPAKA